MNNTTKIVGEWNGELIWQYVGSRPVGVEPKPDKTLKQIKEEMTEIAGEWNGDEAGLQEERAHTALDVITKLNEVEELLAEL